MEKHSGGSGATLKVLIADDHGLVREGLKSTLTGFTPHAIILEATNAGEVRSLLSMAEDLDLVLLDLRMPGVSGFELLDRLRAERPDTPVVVLSASEDVPLMQASIERGAAGYIPKSAPQSIMVAALRLVLSGGVYIPPALIGQRPATELSLNSALQQRSGAAADTQNSGLSNLTKRQREVLTLLGNGKSNKAIARALGLSEHTVKIHISALFKALNVANRTEAALLSKQLGLSDRT